MRLSTSKKGRTSYRLKNWDYSWNASYFVTLCTAQRHCYFGRIEGEKICFSPEGAVADVLWHEIKNHAKNVELGSYVIMPNHVRGIITLNNDIKPVFVGTRHALSLQKQQKQPENNRNHKSRFQNQGKNSLSSIVGSYKSAVTKHIRRLGFDFNWQPRFYDHIIRDKTSYLRISQYIDNNPANWNHDKFWPANK